MSMEPEPIEEPMDDNKKYEIGESDLRELNQAMFEIKLMHQSGMWEILEELGKELQVRGKAIEMYAKHKLTTDPERNN